MSVFFKGCMVDGGCKDRGLFLNGKVWLLWEKIIEV